MAQKRLRNTALRNRKPKKNTSKLFTLPNGGEQGVLKDIGAIQEKKDTADHYLQGKTHTKKCSQKDSVKSHSFQLGVKPLVMCSASQQKKEETYSLPAVILPAAIHSLQERKVVQ